MVFAIVLRSLLSIMPGDGLLGNVILRDVGSSH